MGRNPQHKAKPKGAALAGKPARQLGLDYSGFSPRQLGLSVLSRCLLDIREILEKPDQIHWEPDTTDFDEENPFGEVGLPVKTGAKYALQNLLALDRLIHEAEDNTALLLGDPLKSEVLRALSVVHTAIGQAEIPVESSIYDRKERMGIRFAIERVTCAKDRDGGTLARLADAVGDLCHTAEGPVRADAASKMDPLKNPNLSRSTRRLWEKLRAVQKPQTTDDMEGWGFSRKTVIKAVKELKDSGHITRCTGGGVLPREPK